MEPILRGASAPGLRRTGKRHPRGGRRKLFRGAGGVCGTARPWKGKSTCLNRIATLIPTKGHIRVRGQMTVRKGRPPARPVGAAGLPCFRTVQPAGHPHRLREHCSGPYHPGDSGGGDRGAGQGDGGAARHHRLPEQIPLPDVRRTAPADGGRPGHHHRPRPGAGRRAHRALDSRSAKLLLDRFEALNREGRATILMVTHDAFTASYCRRILFLQDGAVLTQLERGGQSRRAFFQQIIGVVTRLGGDQSDVL